MCMQHAGWFHLLVWFHIQLYYIDRMDIRLYLHSRALAAAAAAARAPAQQRDLPLYPV